MAQSAIVRPRSSPTTRPRKSARPASPAATKETAKKEARRVKSTATGQAKQVKSTATHQTRNVARTAEQDARDLAGTVRDQAEQVKGELAGQARELVSDTRDQIENQADMQAFRLAEALFQVGSQAVALADGRPDEAGPLVDYAEAAADWLDGVAGHIEERGIEGLATDVVELARRRPGMFLAGAAVVGFGVGRLLRSGAVSGNGVSTNGSAGELGWEEDPR